jgi:hypothetical protein
VPSAGARLLASPPPGRSRPISLGQGLEPYAGTWTNPYVGPPGHPLAAGRAVTAGHAPLGPRTGRAMRFRR